MKRSTIFIIAGFVISLVIVPLIVYALLSAQSANHSQQLTNNPPLRSDDEIATVIAKSNSYLHDSDGKPTFKLLKTKRLANNWYMAWIDTKTLKVLVNDPSVNVNYMSVTLGPATDFDSAAIYGKGIPSAVYQEFIDAQYN